MGSSTSCFGFLKFGSPTSAPYVRCCQNTLHVQQSILLYMYHACIWVHVNANIYSDIHNICEYFCMHAYVHTNIGTDIIKPTDVDSLIYSNISLTHTHTRLHICTHTQCRKCFESWISSWANRRATCDLLVLAQDFFPATGKLPGLWGLDAAVAPSKCHGWFEGAGTFH